jgi:heterotetrameric sarcosine oxidase gamma subunit
LIVAERDLARPALDPACGTVLDLSHARTVIRVEGADAADLMARLLPIDMRPVSFPEGSVATAGLHHVGVTVLAREGGFDLLVPQTFARSLFEHVVEIAAQFGVAIG